MPDPAPIKVLKSRISHTADINWRELSFIQHEEFKELVLETKEKLKASILQNQFSDPFKVWADPASGKFYCLDGKHRTMILEELVKEGHDVPQLLPATFILCDDQREAAKLVLQYSSAYARVTAQGFQKFISDFNLDQEELSFSINIPELALPSITPISGDFSDEGIGVKNQYGVIVMCENEGDQQFIFEELTAKGYKCKVVVT